MNGDLARNRSDTAAYDHRRHIDLLMLQPYGATHIIDIEPRTREDTLLPRQRSHHQDLLTEFVEHQCTGECFIVGQRDDNVGFVALGCPGEVEAELASPLGTERLPVDRLSARGSYKRSKGRREALEHFAKRLNRGFP